MSEHAAPRASPGDVYISSALFAIQIPPVDCPKSPPKAEYAAPLALEGVKVTRQIPVLSAVAGHAPERKFSGFVETVRIVAMAQVMPRSTSPIGIE